MKIWRFHIKLVTAWFDFWIGLYWDRKQKVLYFLPIPMVGIAISKQQFSGDQIEDDRQIAKEDA